MEHDIIYDIKDDLSITLENITESFCAEPEDGYVSMNDQGKYLLGFYCGADSITDEQKINVLEHIKTKFGVTECYISNIQYDVDDITGQIYGFNITFNVEI